MAVKPKSFWSSTAGFVTGVAGILTAVAGLATVATQAGWVGSNGNGSSDVKTTETTEAPGGTSGGAGGGGTGSPASGTPTFTVDPQSVTFQSLGPRQATVKLVNGPVRATLATPTIEGANAGSFDVTSACPSRLEPGGRCDIEVTFAPPRGGSYSAVLVVRVQGAPEKNVPLKGDAVL